MSTNKNRTVIKSIGQNKFIIKSNGSNCAKIRKVCPPEKLKEKKDNEAVGMYFDVVKVYSSRSLDELVSASKSITKRKSMTFKGKTVFARKFKNVLYGITSSDLIEIARQ